MVVCGPRGVVFRVSFHELQLEAPCLWSSAADP